MASRRAAVLALGAQRGVFWKVACRSGACKHASCLAVSLARAYAAAAGQEAVAKVHPPQQSMRIAYKDTDMSHTEKWMQARSPEVLMAAGRRPSCSVLRRKLPSLASSRLLLPSLQKDAKAPMDWISEVAPVEVSGTRAKCYGGAFRG